MLGPLGLACSTYYGPSLLNQFTSILLPIDYGPALHKLSAPTLILSYWTKLVTVSYGTMPYDVLRGQEPSQYVSGRQRKQANEA